MKAPSSEKTKNERKKEKSTFDVTGSLTSRLRIPGFTSLKEKE